MVGIEYLLKGKKIKYTCFLIGTPITYTDRSVGNHETTSPTKADFVSKYDNSQRKKK